MSIFGGKKDNENNQDAFDEADDFDQETLAALGPVGGTPKGGSKVALFGGILAVVTAGLGGGYFYVTSMQADMPAPKAPIMAIQTASDALLPGTDMSFDAPAADRVAADENITLPMMDPLATEAPLMGEVSEDNIDPALDNTMGAMSAPVIDMADHMQETAAIEDTPFEDAATMPDEMELAEDTEIIAPEASLDNMIQEGMEMPADVMAGIATPATAPVDMPITETGLPGAMEEMPGMEAPVASVEDIVDPSTAAAIEEDLPMPMQEEPPMPSAAEAAIVENAAIMDSVTQSAVDQNVAPVQGTTQSAATTTGALPAIAAEIPAEKAMIRPLPKKYLVVTKNKSGGSADSRNSAARRALAEGNNAAALQLFNDLLHDYPNDNRALMGKAVALQKMGRGSDALVAYETVLMDNPKNLEALTNMLGLLKRENPTLATERLLELRRVYPNNADIAAQLGLAYADVGSFDEGMKYLNVAESLNPGSAYILFNKAVLFDKAGKTAQAGDLYRQILRMAADRQLDQPLPIEVIQKRLSVLR